MNGPTLGQLEAFVWTARLGSVELAARHLHRSQPSVSLRLRDLQTALDTRLLQRAGRGVKLTAEGHMFLDRAQGVLKALENLQFADEREISGSIRFGLADGFATVCLPALLGALQRELPKLQIDLTIATSGGLEQHLGDDLLDLAILVNPIGRPNLQLVPLGPQETTWAAGPSWQFPLEARPRDLWQAPILTNPPPSPAYRQVMAWFATARLSPAKLILCSSGIVIGQLISAGIGIGVMPAKMIAPYVKEGTIVPLTTIPPLEPGQVFASYRADVPKRAIEAIIGISNRVLEAIGYFAAHAS
jgi:DNA-binding transcriptional LysR family regulator